MEIKIKRLHPEAVIPTKGTPDSACYDVYAPCDFEVHEGRNIMPLGWAIELPQGYAAEIRPRSGYSSKGFAGTRGVKEYGTTVRDSVLTLKWFLKYFCIQKDIWVTTRVCPQYIRMHGNVINITVSTKD